MAMKLLCITFAFLATANGQDAACTTVPDLEETSEQGEALLQTMHAKGKKADTEKACSYQLQENQDGSTACTSLEAGTYISGGVATLDESGYQETGKLCCHHEMSLFARREIARQGFDVCDLSDLHGFVHWYDCSNDNKTFVKMQEEIAGAMTGNCPWLGHLPNCPVKGTNCHECPTCPTTFPADSAAGQTAEFDEAGYASVAKRCCCAEMETYIRRLITAEGMQVCEEGSLQGFLHWFDCTDDGQTFAKLKEGIVMARSGLPPLCPWLGSIGETCPPRGHNCPVVEVPEPAAHRRRTACR